MRNLIPLKLATRTTGAASCEDVTASADSSFQSSGSYWMASDNSAPPTPTFSLRGHSRFPSSSSSLTSSSTSPICEQSDVCGSASKLPMPKLTEDPTEHDDTMNMQNNHLQDMSAYELETRAKEFKDRTRVVLREGSFYDLESSFGDDNEACLPRALKRQESNDSPIGTLSIRLGERFPSFGGRWRQRKPPQLYTGSSLQSLASSQPASSRSSSLTSSNFPGFDQTELPPTPSSSTRAEFNIPASPIGISHSEDKSLSHQDLASTPLLPPMMVRPWGSDHGVQSPLQTPSIADPNKTFSTISSPTGTPLLLGSPSPTLSTRPSVASFHKSRTGPVSSYLPVSSDVPPLFIADPTDEWSIKLGHANYSIFPEPYLPEVCDALACHQLVADWELARTNYFRHKHRTIEHYGSNSKTFKLTEQKWAYIEALWRKNNDQATAEAARNSTDDHPITPTEPAPLTAMPTLDDPRSEGKFPKLGDQDIVGPMEQIAARAQPLPRRQTNVAKLFSNIFGRPTRSRSATR